MIFIYSLKRSYGKHLFADTVSTPRDSYPKTRHSLFEKHYRIEASYGNIPEGVFRRCWWAPCESPRWLVHAQRSTTATSADAVGEEERHIAARLWS
jgi:hypothetical protein